MDPITYLMTMFILGAICGALFAINKKVVIALWFIAGILFLIGVSTGGTADMSVEDMSNFYYVPGIILFVIGCFAGKGMIEMTFKQDGGMGNDYHYR